uniref:EGF-like domain-containing protein n=1 Tax=Strongyloides stercoralis TaxID=6248 RepID=A0AAF5CS45_STRER
MILKFASILTLFSIVLSQITEIYEITNLPTSNPSFINSQIQTLSDELYRLNLQINNLFTSVSNDSTLCQQVHNLSIQTNKLLNISLVDLKNRVTNSSNTYNTLIPTLSNYITKVKCMSNSGCIPSHSTTPQPPLITTTLTSINNDSTCNNLLINNSKILNKKIETVNCNWNLLTISGKKYTLSLQSFIVQGNASIIVHDNLKNKDVITLNNSIENPITIDSNGYNYNISITSDNTLSGVKFEIDYQQLDVCDVNTCSNNGTCIVDPDNMPKCMCTGCWMGSNNCQKKYNPCDTYLKCKTVDGNNNPTGNTCKPLETVDKCVAQCYCKGSNTAKPYYVYTTSTQKISNNVFSTPLTPSQIIQNAHDLSLKIESLSNDITNYISQLNNNKSKSSCLDSLLKNVIELDKNVSNVVNDVNKKQENILTVESEIKNIKNIATCMKNSMCVPSPTTYKPTLSPTLKPINNKSCDELNNNGIISNGNDYENINCQWNINTTQSKYVSLNINYIYIKGNASLIVIDKFHGNQTVYNTSIYESITLSSYSNNYNISIISNGSYSGVSFKLTYNINDVCYQNYCQNNGACTVKPDNTPSCQCKGCFYGDTCNDTLDKCKTYTKCLQNKNPNNKCNTLSIDDNCVAKCYCMGSNIPTAFCRN